MIVLKHIRIFNGVNECDIYLIGTAHVSKDSIKEVGKYVAKIKLHKKVVVDFEFEVVAE